MAPAVAMLALLAASSAGAPPVVAMGADQALAALNAAWTRQGRPRFEPASVRDAAGLLACSRDSLCVLLTGSAARVEAIVLTGPVEPRAASVRYLAAQSLLLRLTAPGAPVLPVVTADRIAAGGTAPAEAQLGPTCVRVQPSDAKALSTRVSRGRCGPLPPQG